MKTEWVCDTSKGGTSCGGCSSCKARADEKVIDYLERAREIVIYFQNKYKDPIDRTTNDIAVLEIAKLLQREEHKTELQEYGLNVNNRNQY